VGQPIAVEEKPSSRPGVVRFVANRSLTGMGHERFTRDRQPTGDRPVDEVARRLLATGRVDGVHAYANVITVDLSKGYTSEGLREIVEELYVYYRPGVVPPTDEEVIALGPTG
jgi:hypothetical protein